MIPIPVVWTHYTATVRGRVLKLVPCENCSTEYVYALEREGEGAGTSLYLLNEEGRDARIERGRSRALTRAEFEAAQQREHGAAGGAGTPDHEPGATPGQG